MRKNNKTQGAVASVYDTHTTQEKRVPIVAEEMSQVLFSIVTGIKGAMVGYIDEAASISHGMVMRMIDAVDILENNCEIDSLANQRWSHYYKRL